MGVFMEVRSVLVICLVKLVPWWDMLQNNIAIAHSHIVFFFLFEILMKLTWIYTYTCSAVFFFFIMNFNCFLKYRRSWIIRMFYFTRTINIWSILLLLIESEVRIEREKYVHTIAQVNEQYKCLITIKKDSKLTYITACHFAYILWKSYEHLSPAS
jgi:hypothetical protein